MKIFPIILLEMFNPIFLTDIYVGRAGGIVTGDLSIFPRAHLCDVHSFATKKENTSADLSIQALASKPQVLPQYVTYIRLD